MAPGGGPPGIDEGIDGLFAFNGEVTYRTATTHRLFRALLSSGAAPQIQFFSYVGTSANSIADCCSPGRKVWRDEACATCPDVVFDAYPRVAFYFSNQLFYVMPDYARRVLHWISSDNTCYNAAFSFTSCAESADAGTLGWRGRRWGAVSLIGAHPYVHVRVGQAWV